jgi:hypothetical protein
LAATKKTAEQRICFNSASTKVKQVKAASPHGNFVHGRFLLRAAVTDLALEHGLLNLIGEAVHVDREPIE